MEHAVCLWVSVYVWYECAEVFVFADDNMSPRYDRWRDPAAAD